MSREQEIDQDGQALVARVAALAVVDQDSFTAAGEQLQVVKLYQKRVHEVMDPVVEAAFRAHRVATQQRAALLIHAESAERQIKAALAGYAAEQDRQRRAAEAEARAEQARLEAAERARVEAESARLLAEAEARQVADALAAEQAGDLERAQRIIETPVVMPTVAPRPVVAPPAVVAAPPTAPGISFRQTWDFEVTDARQLPEQYRIPDLIAIRKVVQALGERANIPGVRVFAKSVVAARA